VRRLADRMGSAEALLYQHIVSEPFSVCFTAEPHICSLNGDFPAKVAFTPHIWTCMHDALCAREPVRAGVRGRVSGRLHTQSVMM
jgi:hypothetical protein